MTQTRRLLIVDDDADLRHALDEQLALHPEFEVEMAETAAAAFESVALAAPDLVIMDVGLPDLDGREAVTRLRRDGYRRPIIMLTAHDSDADAVRGLDSGANDFVGKPFRFVVLLARIRAQLASTNPATTQNSGSALTRSFRPRKTWSTTRASDCA